jgi:hypothetical protein
VITLSGFHCSKLYQVGYNKRASLTGNFLSGKREGGMRERGRDEREREG